MLIDAAYPEEIRIAVLSNGQIEDFDLEVHNKRQLRGNIYLAKIAAVEPSLQAAFVEYSGNRHGFLAFDDIHPDYFQIPQEDRDALLVDEAALSGDDSDNDEDAHIAAEGEDHESSTGDGDTGDSDSDSEENTSLSSDISEADEMREAGKRLRKALSRRCKIQEVIKRRQIILVQVTKEERGNKGAALTTYLSLAGRYCVLMPNTSRGGGVSRKITSLTDRKRLKKITDGFDLPDGMGLIVRTAGAKRSRLEIERDYDYLLKLWSTIRETTLNSTAPCLVHEEGSLVLRAVRDLYDPDIDTIHVEGETTCQEVANSLDMLMPGGSEKVKRHDSPLPLFVAHGIEKHLAQVFSPKVEMKSGGYLVVNQTEALVAIDVNSGRSTRERSIETTALRTNIEAAHEAARQMRLRDLAGLIVIDFIDMEDNRNVRAVEKEMRKALDMDRARVQMSSISKFGLMELSRQRRRVGVIELTSTPCPACDGQGRVRIRESLVLEIVRALKTRTASVRRGDIILRLAPATALHVLNTRRADLTAVEKHTGCSITVVTDPDLHPDTFAITRTINGRNAALSDPAVTPVAATASDTGNTRRSRRRGGAGRRGNGDSALQRPARSGSSRRERSSRIPDIALDGGEMLDAIASAPFLTTGGDEQTAPNEDSSKASPPVLESVIPAETASAGDTPIAIERAESEPDIQPPKPPKPPKPPQPPQPSQPISSIHSIHDTTADAKERKQRVGWWSKKPAS